MSRSDSPRSQKRRKCHKRLQSSLCDADSAEERREKILVIATAKDQEYGDNQLLFEEQKVCFEDAIFVEPGVLPSDRKAREARVLKRLVLRHDAVYCEKNPNFTELRLWTANYRTAVDLPPSTPNQETRLAHEKPLSPVSDRGSLLSQEEKSRLRDCYETQAWKQLEKYLHRTLLPRRPKNPVVHAMYARVLALHAQKPQAAEYHYKQALACCSDAYQKCSFLGEFGIFLKCMQQYQDAANQLRLALQAECNGFDLQKAEFSRLVAELLFLYQVDSDTVSEAQRCVRALQHLARAETLLNKSQSPQPCDGQLAGSLCDAEGMRSSALCGVLHLKGHIELYLQHRDEAEALLTRALRLCRSSSVSVPTVASDSQASREFWIRRDLVVLLVHSPRNTARRLALQHLERAVVLHKQQTQGTMVSSSRSWRREIHVQGCQLNLMLALTQQPHRGDEREALFRDSLRGVLDSHISDGVDLRKCKHAHLLGDALFFYARHLHKVRKERSPRCDSPRGERFTASPRPLYEFLLKQRFLTPCGNHAKVHLALGVYLLECGGEPRAALMHLRRARQLNPHIESVRAQCWMLIPALEKTLRRSQSCGLPSFIFGANTSLYLTKSHLQRDLLQQVDNDALYTLLKGRCFEESGADYLFFWHLTLAAHCQGESRDCDERKKEARYCLLLALVFGRCSDSYHPLVLGLMARRAEQLFPEEEGLFSDVRRHLRDYVRLLTGERRWKQAEFALRFMSHELCPGDFETLRRLVKVLLKQNTLPSLLEAQGMLSRMLRFFEEQSPRAMKRGRPAVEDQKTKRTRRRSRAETHFAMVKVLRAQLPHVVVRRSLVRDLDLLRSIARHFCAVMDAVSEDSLRRRPKDALAHFEEFLGFHARHGALLGDEALADLEAATEHFVRCADKAGVTPQLKEDLKIKAHVWGLLIDTVSSKDWPTCPTLCGLVDHLPEPLVPNQSERMDSKEEDSETTRPARRSRHVRRDTLFV